MPDFVTASFGIKSPIAPEPVQKVEKHKIDTSGVKVGSVLMHKNFGEGLVVSLENDLMLIKFEEGEKKFRFSNAIAQGFLTIV
jgi:hypothetical protein